MAELDPYSREDSTRLPIGEPKRNDEVVSKYESDGFSNEAEGVVFAMLMQYAKTDSENAENRARQFAKILYEYSAKLIKDLPVGNSVIAKKIAKAIDNKVSSEMNDLAKGIDFIDEIYDIRSTVSDYLSSLISLANGDLITSEQLGLTQKSGKKQQSAIEQKIDSEISESFIELIQKENTIAPDTRKMPVNPRALTIPVQTLAKNAEKFFGTSIESFTSKLAVKTIERLENIQTAISNFGQFKKPAAGEINKSKVSSGKGISDSHRTIEGTIRVKRGSIPAYLMSIHTEAQTMQEEQARQERNLKGWVTTLDDMKKAFDNTKKIVGSIISGTIYFAEATFKKLSDGIKSTYKKIKSGGFLKFLFSPAGILAIGLLGWAGYKLIFSGIGTKIKNNIISAIKSAISATIPIFGIFFGTNDGDELKNGELSDDEQTQKEASEEKIKTGIFKFLDGLSLFDKNEQDGQIDDSVFQDEESEETGKEKKGFFTKLTDFTNNEFAFYSSLDIGANGVGKTGDQITDHWLGNIIAMETAIDGFSKEKFGCTAEEWIMSLGTNHTSSLSRGEHKGGWISEIKSAMSGFWQKIETNISRSVDWFKQTTLGKKITMLWDFASGIAKTMYNIFRRVIDATAHLKPFIDIVQKLLLPPVGPILYMLVKLGKFINAVKKIAFVQPVLGAIGNLIKIDPLTGVIIIGLALGLGTLGVGVWNMFMKKPLDNGGVMPREQYAISMGLANGQIDPNSIDSRVSRWKNEFETYNPLTEEGETARDRLSKRIKFIEYGLTQFEENYQMVMENQDKKPGTLHWYIRNRETGSKISQTIWAKPLAEMPILGIGPNLIHSAMYYDFVKQLDTKFPGTDEGTWENIREMLMRMKEVDRLFRYMFDIAKVEDIDNFIKSIQNNEIAKTIYNWVHGDKKDLDLQTFIQSLFGIGLTERLNKIPNISLEFVESLHGKWNNVTIKVGNEKETLEFPIIEKSKMTYIDTFNTLFSGLTAEGVKLNPQGERLGVTVSKINPMLAARAFVNYMQRPKSDFYSLQPWGFSKADVEKLTISTDENKDRPFKMSQLVKEVDQYKNRSIAKITDKLPTDVIKNRYKDLPDFDGRNDSKALVGMIYILGKILQMCDDIK